MLVGTTVFIAAYLLYPVNKIEVKGAKMLPESEVRAAIGDHASMATLNPRVVERKLKANPWVYSVSLLKNWDSGIVTVQVEERRAVLNGVLGGQKIILAEDGTRLPGLGGARLPVIPLNQRQLDDITNSMKVLRENGVVVNSVDEVGAGGTVVSVKSQQVIFAGEVQQGQAQTLSQLIKDNPGARRFDLRTPQRVVISYDGLSRSTNG